MKFEMSGRGETCGVVIWSPRPITYASCDSSRSAVSCAYGRHLASGAVAVTDLVPAGATAVFANVTVTNSQAARSPDDQPRCQHHRGVVGDRLVSHRSDTRERTRAYARRRRADHVIAGDVGEDFVSPRRVASASTASQGRRSAQAGSSRRCS